MGDMADAYNDEIMDNCERYLDMMSASNLDRYDAMLTDELGYELEIPMLVPPSDPFANKKRKI